MEYPYKIVDFEKYCPKCKYYKRKESEDPCNDCLNEGGNIQSEKPVNFKEKQCMMLPIFLIVLCIIFLIEYWI